MSDYTAIAIAEGFEQVDTTEEVIAAWQHLIDTGLVWRLQGHFGRTARHLIDNGICRRAQ